MNDLHSAVIIAMLCTRCGQAEEALGRTGWSAGIYYLFAAIWGVSAMCDKLIS